jgi:hypothetical protein
MTVPMARLTGAMLVINVQRFATSLVVLQFIIIIYALLYCGIVSDGVFTKFPITDLHSVVSSKLSLTA